MHACTCGRQAIQHIRRSPRPRHIVDGFDFADIAAQSPRLQPRSFQLSDTGDGWAHLIDAIGANTLFGKGFGSLIQPVFVDGHTACQACGYAIDIPHGQNYLGARTSVIQAIKDDHGGPEEKTLAQDLDWYYPQHTFRPCSGNCKDSSAPRLQVLHCSKLGLKCHQLCFALHPRTTARRCYRKTAP